MLRIGIDYRPVTAAPQGGIPRQVCALRDSLGARPATAVTLFTAAPHDHDHRQIAVCPPFATAPQALHRPPQRLRFEVGFLPRALAAAGVDLYIATANSGLPWFHRRRDTKYALLLHDVFQLTLVNRHGSAFKQHAYRAFDRFTIGRAVAQADRIWTPSRYTAQQAAAHFPQVAAKVRVLPNMVPGFAHIAPDPDALQLPARYWLAVGTREPRKNIPLLLAAWQAARQASAAVPPLVLVGSRDDLPAAYRAQPDLLVRHGLSEAQLAALYRDADYLWQPSYAEGFGLPVIEALSVGTPVCVAHGSALDEIAPPDAPRFDPHDAPALAALMLRLAAAPAPGSVAVRQAWAARYDAHAYGARLHALIEELVAPCR
jgi:glycosyltransferase involved in cell wall biosynthesis